MGFDEKPISETGGASGDADGETGIGGGLLDRMIGGATPFDTKSVDTFHKDADMFKDWAGQGKFAVNEEAMRAYTKVCDAYIDGWQHVQREAQLLTTSAPMGSSPFAKQIAEYNVKVAEGDERSLLPNLRKMYDGFTKMKEGLAIARKNYNEADSDANISFTKFKLD
ncbi:MAG: hypothetical protein GEU86_05410 [Actinophytocola sp.]|nr:hypothetical protein [Actinophytocola sp.]